MHGALEGHEQAVRAHRGSQTPAGEIAGRRGYHLVRRPERSSKCAWGEVSAVGGTPGRRDRAGEGRQRSRVSRLKAERTGDLY